VFPQAALKFRISLLFLDLMGIVSGILIHRSYDPKSTWVVPSIQPAENPSPVKSNFFAEGLSSRHGY
jgi:hypothetical protein